MAYDGTIELISGIKQKNNQDFALVDASAVNVTTSITAYKDMRLDEVLNNLNGDVVVINKSTSDLSEKVELSVVSVDVEYYISDSNSELINGTWSTDAPTNVESGKYVWSRTKTTLTNGATNYTTASCIANTSSGGTGESSLTVQITSSNGNIFMSRNISTILTCTVYYGLTNVTDKVTKFTWQKIDKNGNIDNTWSRSSASSIQLSEADVLSRASFNCEVEVNI